MDIIFSKSTDVEEFRKDLNRITSNNKVNGVLVFVSDGNGFSPKDLNPVLTNTKTPVFGGVFPGILYKDSRYEKGYILVGLPNEPEIHTITNISNSDEEFHITMMNYFKDKPDVNTIMVFVDGFAEKINKLIESLFMNFGLEYNYIGGGAGSLSMEQSPCIISNKGLLTDSAIIAGCSVNGGIGVQHGWKSIAGPFKITGADKSRIISLDFKPAFEVYKEVVDAHSTTPIQPDNFFDVSKCYPFGITKLDSEKIIRDPIKVDNYNNIVCVGEVNEGAFVHIMHGDKPSLVKAAKNAKKLSMASFSNKKNSSINVFIDCISRVLFLEENFQEEINAVYDKNLPLIGALTIGEIANNGKDYLEFYNKTSVVGCFEL